MVQLAWATQLEVTQRLWSLGPVIQPGARTGRASGPQGGTSVSASQAWTPSRPLVEPAGEGLLCSEGVTRAALWDPQSVPHGLKWQTNWFLVTHNPHHMDVSPGVNYLPVFPRTHLLRFEANPPATPGFPWDPFGHLHPPSAPASRPLSAVPNVVPLSSLPLLPSLPGAFCSPHPTASLPTRASFSSHHSNFQDLKYPICWFPSFLSASLL